MHVSIRNLHKSFGAVHANNDICVEFAAGQIHGILGENGAGKSTLMKLLSGVYRPDSGTILINDVVVQLGTPRRAIEAGIGMVAQDPVDVPVFSVIDNIACGIHMPATQQLQSIIVEWCDRLGFQFAPETSIRSLTVGQRQQVEIVRLLIAGSDVLILDEPTTGITASQIQALFSALRTIVATGKTVLFVTHKLDEVAALCDTVTVLRAGTMVGVQRAMPMSQAEMIEAMFGTLSPDVHVPFVRETQTAARWMLNDVSFLEHMRHIGPLNYTIPSGAIIGLAGLEGSGQRPFMQLLSGLRQPTQGIVHYDDAPFAYDHPDVVWLPADRLTEGIIGDMSLVEHIRLLRDVLLDGDVSPQQKAIQLIRDYAIKATPEMPLRQLSGGNQQRAMLALIPDHVTGIVLEHPTRGLDAVSARAIWQRLQERCSRGATVVFFSADLDEVLQYADFVIVFFAGQLSRIIPRAQVSDTNLAALIGGVGFDEVLP